MKTVFEANGILKEMINTIRSVHMIITGKFKNHHFTISVVTMSWLVIKISASPNRLISLCYAGNKRHFERGNVQCCSTFPIQSRTWIQFKHESKSSLSYVHIKSPSEWCSNLGELIGDSLRNLNCQHRAVAVKEAPNTETHWDTTWIILSEISPCAHESTRGNAHHQLLLISSLLSRVYVSRHQDPAHNEDVPYTWMEFSHFVSFKCRHSQY